MTIQMLRSFNGLEQGQVYTLTSAQGGSTEEGRLVSANLAQVFVAVGTFAALLADTAPASLTRSVSDYGAGASGATEWKWDGAMWRPVGGVVVFAHSGTTIEIAGSASGSGQPIATWIAPPGSFLKNSTHRYNLSMTHTGTNGGWGVQMTVGGAANIISQRFLNATDHSCRLDTQFFVSSDLQAISIFQQNPASPEPDVQTAVAAGLAVDLTVAQTIVINVYCAVGDTVMLHGLDWKVAA